MRIWDDRGWNGVWGVVEYCGVLGVVECGWGLGVVECGWGLRMVECCGVLDGCMWIGFEFGVADDFLVQCNKPNGR